MPEWWMDLMYWMDNSYIPLWVLILAGIAWFGYRFVQDMKQMFPPE
jgi:hypothetical protein